MERGEFHPGEMEARMAEQPAIVENRLEEPRAAEANNREITEEVPKPEAAEKRKDIKEPLAFEKLPDEIQVKILNQLLEGMREAVGPVRDYAVFASTAMYLNGEKLVTNGDEGGKELMKPPGDFDAALWKLEDLDTIRNRMRRMPDVIFSNAKKDEAGKVMRDEAGEVIYDGKPGEYGSLPGQDLKILAGKRMFDVEIDGKPEQVAYDFEFFLNSRMVQQDMARGNTTEAHGLRILNLEGLQRQYQENLNFELKINSAVQNIVAELHTTDPEKLPLLKAFKQEIMSLAEGEEAESDDVVITDQAREILTSLDIHPREMKEVFKIQAELDEIESKSEIPFARLTQEGFMERYVEAQRAAGNVDKAKELEKTYKHTQELISKRATLIAGTKTKIWKRDLNLIQLARLRKQN